MRKFIVGTDWWTDCDDAVALRLLARAHQSGEIRMEGIYLNGCMEHSAASLDGFLRYEGVCDVPLGIDLEATDFGGQPPYQRRLAAMAGRYLRNEDAEDAVRLLRRLLAQAEERVEMIEIGYPQVIVRLLMSGADDLSEKTGYGLICEKVEKLWIMAGKWDENPGRENNFARNDRARRAAHTLCETWPTVVTFLGWEVGFDVITGKYLREGDPLLGALQDHGSPGGRSSWDPMLALLALTGDEGRAGYAVAPGRASVDAATGLNAFRKGDDGPHRYVVRQHAPAWYEEIIEQMIASR